MTNPFYVSGAGGGLKGIGDLLNAYNKREDDQKKEDETKAAQFEMQALIEDGDEQAINSYMINNPEKQQEMTRAFGFKTEATRKNAVDTAMMILDDSLSSEDAIRDRAAMVSMQGGDPSDTLALLDLLGKEGGDEEMKDIARKSLTIIGNPQEREAYGVSQSKAAMTPYQSERLKLDAKGIKIRELESKLRQEENVIKRKSLENRLAKESMALQTQELKMLADNKGGAAQKMLRDASESEKKALSFARRMTDSGNQLNELEASIDPTARVIGFISGGKGIASEAANRMASPEEQAYASAASDFVTAQLRQESGAAIGEQEFERKYREFFPMPGDSDDQITLKRERRQEASADMGNLSGGLYSEFYGSETEDIPVSNNAPTEEYTEGMTATNPATGQTMRFIGGAWE